MKHFDRWLMMGIAGVFAVVGVICAFWAALLLLLQGLCWLRFGEWQPLPMYALFVTDAAQAGLQHFSCRVQPLGIVPAWGQAEAGPEVASRLAGPLVGVAKVLLWLIDASLVLWLLLLGGGALALASIAAGEIGKLD